MADQPIRDLGIRPTGDDQQWKAEVQRILTELIRRDKARETRIQALEERTR